MGRGVEGVAGRVDPLEALADQDALEQAGRGHQGLGVGRLGVGHVAGGQVEGVEDREELLDQGQGGPGRLVGLLLGHPLLVVLEFGLEPAEGRALLSGLEVPLQTIIQETATAILHGLGLGRQDETVSQLGVRWNGGKVVLHPADPTLQTKEVPMDVFFHKIVMMRNNFRVLEQKINSNEKLTDGEKVEMQQYISRCYGSMTTFNLLFRNKEDQFGE